MSDTFSDLVRLRSCDTEEDFDGGDLAVPDSCLGILCRRPVVALRCLSSGTYPGALGGPAARAWRQGGRVVQKGPWRLDRIALSRRPFTASCSSSSSIRPDSPPA